MGLMEEERVLLPERQYRLVKALAGMGGRAEASRLAEAVGRKQSDIMRDLAELESKNLVKVLRVKTWRVCLSPDGRRYLKEGLPEERLLKIVEVRREFPSVKELAKACGLSRNEFAAAFGRLRKYGVVKVVSGKVIYSGDGVEKLLSDIRRTRELLGNISECIHVRELPEWVAELKRRGMVEVTESRVIEVEATGTLRELLEAGRVSEAPLITRITSEVIVSGKWRGAILKEFDLSIEVPVKYPSRKHPYVEFLNHVREVVESMGFVEAKGPHVETALWNFDVLFVPQYHPARRESDVYFVAEETVGVAPSDVLERTREVHERVWKYRWDPREALKLVLRTHTTPVSMRTIYSRKEGEYRVYSLDRVFRPDTPDPTHLMEFHQLEGIIVGKHVTFKHLLGFFKEFAKRLGLGEVRFRPAYFPFTEPSVEGYIKHPKLGWIEVFPGGMFRPEVLYAVGLKDHNVAAWGIGIDRIAMMVLNMNDIRNLYTNDVDIIRSTPLPKEVMR